MLITGVAGLLMAAAATAPAQARADCIAVPIAMALHDAAVRRQLQSRVLRVEHAWRAPTRCIRLAVR